VFRRFVLAGLIAFAAVPVAALAINAGAVQIAGLTLLVVVLWFAHRSNVQEELAILTKRLPQTR